ncbi:MAG TPA: DUF4129 domain-containing protein [Candidatus Baltobacteraceae bacterium]|nr:DUF4129 domain-containing protein [Candidatus Baltobacteraceae bacterium]
MILAALPAFGARRPPADPNALAREIVLHGNYRLHSAAETLSPWRRFLAWIGNLLDKLFGHAHAPPSGVVDLLGWILLAVVLGGVVFVIVRLLMNITGAAGGPQTRSVRAIQPRVAAKAWYDRALAAAQAGRYREAAVLLFRAALAILDLRGFVHDDPSRTVDECAAELRDRAPQHLQAFGDVARFFTAAFYAEKAVDESAWERARAAYDNLFAAVTRAS